MKTIKSILSLTLSIVGAILIVSTGDPETTDSLTKLWNISVHGGTFTAVFNTLTFLK